MPKTKELQEPLLERLSSSPEVEDTQTSAKKRKRGADPETEPEPLSKRAAKKAKKAKSKKGNTDEEDDLDLKAGLNKSFAAMDNQLLADYVARQTRKFEGDLTEVELKDKYLPANAIKDTTSWDRQRDLANLPGFLEKFTGNTTKLWGASKKPGAPHTIIVTGAGLRAAEVARAVRSFQTKDVKVAKLFAKHIKLQDSINFLKTVRTGIAVGTPVRLKDLMDDGALKLDRLERIIIDASHIDQKKRGILEMGETQVPLTLWLGQEAIKDRYAAESDAVEILFY